MCEIHGFQEMRIIFYPAVMNKFRFYRESVFVGPSSGLVKQTNVEGRGRSIGSSGFINLLHVFTFNDVYCTVSVGIRKL